LPDEIRAEDLPPAVRRELRGLAPVTAETVARHLVAAGRLLDTDPQGAWRHAQAARALAGRIGLVREAAGIAAYRAGEYGDALAELRAARRITGSPEHLPVMADAERGLGRPDRALAAAAEPDARRLDRAGRVELAIVVSGARRDLGQPDAAVLALRGPELEAPPAAWSPRLYYAYAAALADAGRAEEARQWFTRAAAVDTDGETDALERLADLE